MSGPYEIDGALLDTYTPYHVDNATIVVLYSKALLAGPVCTTFDNLSRFLGVAHHAHYISKSVLRMRLASTGEFVVGDLRVILAP